MHNRSDQQNGNTQLNSEREQFNNRVSNKLFMGRTQRVIWNDRRRYRTI